MAYGYANRVKLFLDADEDTIVGRSVTGVQSTGVRDVGPEQNMAWRQTVRLLQGQLSDPTFENWFIVLEYEIPRRSRRPDVILLSENTVYVVEFKIGAKEHDAASRWQSESYALDFQDFHAASQGRRIVPILCATESQPWRSTVDFRIASGVTELVRSNGDDLAYWLRKCEHHNVDTGSTPLDLKAWLDSDYRPTLNIIEAARELYRGNDVREISHSYAHNLGATIDMLTREIDEAQEKGHRTICFVTGVPGSGKTLAGLELVHDLRVSESYETLPVYLSGNSPLVKVIREALVIDKIDDGHSRKAAEREVKTLIQNVHQFIDGYVERADSAPAEHVVVFDEAQRAWHRRKLDSRRRNNSLGTLDASEPQLLLDVMERLPCWSVVVALVGGGQEIHDGEAGLEEWGSALAQRSTHWRVVSASDALLGGESVAEHRLFEGDLPTNVELREETYAHLDVVVRSHRAQKWAEWVNDFLRLNWLEARAKFPAAIDFPCYATRNLDLARS